MTLLEQVNQMDPEQILFIGSRTNFIFVGNRQEFEDHIDQCMKQTNKMMDREMLNRFIAELEVLINTVNRKQLAKKLKVEYMKRIQQLERLIPTWKEQVALAELPEYKLPIREREVVEVFDRIQGDGTVIIVKGLECGHLWFYEETEWGKRKCG